MTITAQTPTRIEFNAVLCSTEYERLAETAAEHNVEISALDIAAVNLTHYTVALVSGYAPNTLKFLLRLSELSDNYLIPRYRLGRAS